MYPPRSKPTELLKRVFTTFLLLGVGTADISVSASTLIPGFDDIVEQIETPRRSTRQAKAEIAEPDSKTTVKVCVDCAKERLVRRQVKPKREREEPSEQKYMSDSAFDDKVALTAYRNAVRPRRVADFLGGRRVVSGNTSKGLCARAAKETLMDLGVCKTYPKGDAYALEGANALVKSCGERVRITANLDPRKAPKNSIIIYAGYAGRVPHKYGHVENKIIVTAALKRARPNDPFITTSKIGDPLYCSDFCRPVPTLARRGTNKVIAIYQLY